MTRQLSVLALATSMGSTALGASAQEHLALSGGFSLQPDDQTTEQRADPATEQDGIGAGRAPNFPLITFEQGADLRFNPRTGQTGASGKFGLNQYGYRFGLTNVVSPKWILKLDTGVDFYQFDFSGLSGIAGASGDPVADAVGVSVAGTTIHNLSDTVSLFVRAGLAYNGETGAEIRESITGNAIFAGSKKINDKLTLTGGLAVITRLEDPALVVPILGFAYEYSDQVSFATEGLGVNATVKPSDDFSLLFRIAYDTTDFRLDDQGAVRDGVLRVEQIPLTATARWNVIEGVTIEPTVGVMLFQNLTFVTSGGSDAGDAQFDPGLILGLRATFLF